MCRKRPGQRNVVGVIQLRPCDGPWIVLDSAHAGHFWDWKPVTLIGDVLQEILDRD